MKVPLQTSAPTLGGSPFMNYSFRVWLPLVLLLSMQQLSFGLELLSRAVTKENASVPFVALINAQTSGPLSNERIEETWNTNRQPETFEPVAEVDQVFTDAEPQTETKPTEAKAIRRRAISDSSVTGTWLAPTNGFGITDVETRTQLVIPLFLKGTPLRLGLNFATTYMEAPIGIDVPSQLYGLQAELRWLCPIRENTAIDLAAGAGVFSDFSDSDLRGLRVTGRAMLLKTASDRLKWSVGAMYLGRENLTAIPIAGLIYTPYEDLRIELIMPRPRIVRRIAVEGSREYWTYLGMELFGGNTWAIGQSGGRRDVVDYKDSRLIVGFDTKSPGALAGRVELGYVFGRELTFEKDPTELTPGNTLLLRAGMTY
jgi:Domain of unknown function (DUF6268)